ncbi:wax ester/triacylglycerol synthase domain-containing protein [Nonomuraea gerenzanensis]|uniref:diacylglycerol O-acyltransferase n=1 Tax=Nonomuraea gerenzanensis TaxID=93944 RepID=A0A1M4EIZ3_9ACTN|nr:wax ester/triacylglycerol synthase domain-containing protein [Nonomuraea gerenzanensis]UBU10383.1 WS/DGAT domain-containing protein [Nonomuraea gerenzanensis]SBO98776.1 Wax ester synthase/acyl-CoA:diacylglycerol acyltransferase [Nonomuraea gerenzanensis]
MRQLTALDAQFLNVETPTTAAHVAGLAILDSADGAVTRRALAELLLDRVHLSPALSLRLAEVPLGLDHPYWAADPHFDIDNHLFELTLPLPGDDWQLAEAVAQVHARRLDRAHPLWEMHLIHGLGDGKVAVYTKVHHAAIDGVSGAETLATLLDLTPDGHLTSRRCRPTARNGSPAQAAGAGSARIHGPDPAHTRATEPSGSRDTDPATTSHDLAPAHPRTHDAPTLIGMLTGAALRTATHPVRAIQSAVKAAGDLDAIPVIGAIPGANLVAKAARMVARDQHRRPDLPALVVPRTPLNGPISARRHLSFGSLPLKDVKKVAKANGMSVNDVVMTLCTSALRSWLRERNALPEAPLVVAVPVAVRRAKAQDLMGNQISAMVAPMPTNLPDPRERLQAVGTAMGRAKRRFALAPATWLNELCSLLPAPVTTLVTPAIFRLAGMACPPINLIVSNVPGPQFPLYLCGGRVLSYYPLSVLTDMSGGLNITCFSYDGMLDFGIVACPERADDVWGLLEHLRTALDELLDERVSDEFRDGVGVDLVAR